MQNNFIHPTAIIYPNVVMGNNNYIGPYCIIGAPAEHRIRFGTTPDKVIIGDNNTFTGMVTIDGGMERDTTIGNNNFIMKHAYIAHDVIIKDNCTICAGVSIAGHCVINDGVNLGMNAAIHQRVEIPTKCMIGASAFVGKKSKLRPQYKYVGVPVKELKENK